MSESCWIRQITTKVVNLSCTWYDVYDTICQLVKIVWMQMRRIYTCRFIWSFVYIGGIDDHHCLNFLFVVLYANVNWKSQIYYLNIHLYTLFPRQYYFLLEYMTVVLWIIVCSFVIFIAAIVLSVFRFTVSDYSFDILKLFLYIV